MTKDRLSEALWEQKMTVIAYRRASLPGEV
jgi:hypothetical protein